MRERQHQSKRTGPAHVGPVFLGNSAGPSLVSSDLRWQWREDPSLVISRYFKLSPACGV